MTSFFPGYTRAQTEYHFIREDLQQETIPTAEENPMSEEDAIVLMNDILRNESAPGDEDLLEMLCNRLNLHKEVVQGLWALLPGSSADAIMYRQEQFGQMLESRLAPSAIQALAPRATPHMQFAEPRNIPERVLEVVMPMLPPPPTANGRAKSLCSRIAPLVMGLVFGMALPFIYSHFRGK